MGACASSPPRWPRVCATPAWARATASCSSRPSVPEFAGAYYGIHAAGAVAVTANTMSTRPELEYVGEDAGVSLVLGWHEVGRRPPRRPARSASRTGP